jgi:hypothetical protein
MVLYVVVRMLLSLTAPTGQRTAFKDWQSEALLTDGGSSRVGCLVALAGGPSYSRLCLSVQGRVCRTGVAAVCLASLSDSTAAAARTHCSRVVGLLMLPESYACCCCCCQYIPVTCTLLMFTVGSIIVVLAGDRRPALRSFYLEEHLIVFHWWGSLV